MQRPFTSDRDWSFDMEPDRLWSRIAAVEEYSTWWPWLRNFDPAGGLKSGSVWRCEVSPPLPYKLRFRVHIESVNLVDDPHLNGEVWAVVSGDIRGEASLSVHPGLDGGATARLVSRLAPANPLLRQAGRVARPVIEWGHDWVLDEGCRQFVGNAFE